MLLRSFWPADIECIKAVVKSKFQNITLPPERILVYRLKGNLESSQVTKQDHFVSFEIETLATFAMRIACMVSGMTYINRMPQNNRDIHVFTF